MRIAGIMSGTSLDGIDVAIVEIGPGIRTLAFRSVPYPKAVRAALLSVSDALCHTGTISRLNFLLPHLYALAIGDWIRRYRVELIGCHGQTIFHEPYGKPPNTLQIGDGSVLAELTGVPVISDFRPRDIAAGGQGAPLVPFVDYKLFRHRSRGRVVLNIGGIANITAIPPGAKPSEVFAFDTGPGNMIVDALVRHFTKGKRNYDEGGRIAAKGLVHRELLKKLCGDSYYAHQPPKSAGREQYGEQYLRSRLLSTGLAFADLVATTTLLTASTIAIGIRQFVYPKMKASDLIVSGGGVHNPQLMSHLAALLPGTTVQSSSEFGIDPDAKEAIAFAVLANESWRGRVSNLPSATGARRAVVLGKLSMR